MRVKLITLLQIHVFLCKSDDLDIGISTSRVTFLTQYTFFSLCYLHYDKHINIEEVNFI